MMPKPIDFAKVEALRKHMLLTVADISELFGVSRMTYYGWLKGKPIRRKNNDNVRAVLRRLLSVVRDHQWPTPDILAADQKQRKARLDELLNS